MERDYKFIFNPEHDLCLADGTEDFIPPAAVLQFAQQGEWIAKYMPVPLDAEKAKEEAKRAEEEAAGARFQPA